MKSTKDLAAEDLAYQALDEENLLQLAEEQVAEQGSKPKTPSWYRPDAPASWEPVLSHTGETVLVLRYDEDAN